MVNIINQTIGVLVNSCLTNNVFDVDRLYHAVKKQTNEYIMKIMADKSIVEYAFKSLCRENRRLISGLISSNIPHAPPDLASSTQFFVLVI